MTQQARAVHDVSCGKALRERALGGAGSPAPVPAALIAEIAAEIESHCGHRRLKCRRVAMGWTIAQAVAAARQFVEDKHLAKAGMSERSWKDWEAGGLPSPDCQDLLCRLFATHPVELGFARDYSPAPEADEHAPLWSGGGPDGTFPEGDAAQASAGFTEVEATKRRDAVKLAGLAIAAPAAAARILEQAAAEAMEFTQQVEATSLGSGTLDHLDLAVTEFNHAYSLKPPKAVFDAVRDYRRKVNTLLKASAPTSKNANCWRSPDGCPSSWPGSPTTSETPAPVSRSPPTRSSTASRPSAPPASSTPSWAGPTTSLLPDPSLSPPGSRRRPERTADRGDRGPPAGPTRHRVQSVKETAMTTP
ncbi:hypothetical protein [Streptomyces sp. NPDC048644]|uniref:hypothetical protein n=1 Tax=Streptomyces sp. NPDC048644 TaxID=3365582 RepID=UPI0037120E23